MARQTVVWAVAALAFGAVRADAVDWAVGARASTLGVGFELTGRLTDDLNLRGGIQPLPSISYSGEEDDIEYDFEVKLKSFSALLDWHPHGGGFHLTGGVLFNNNEISATAVPTNTFDIGDHTYSAAQVGTFRGLMDFKGTAPYLGLGFGNAVSRGKKLGVVFDLGVVFQGSPRASLSASGPIASDPTFQRDLAEEEANLEEDVSLFKYYPVLSVGLSYRF